MIYVLVWVYLLAGSAKQGSLDLPYSKEDREELAGSRAIPFVFEGCVWPIGKGVLIRFNEEIVAFFAKILHRLSRYEFFVFGC